MSQISRIIPTEIIKSKNTFALWLTFIGAAIIPMAVFITYAYNWQLFIPKMGENPWDEIFIRSFNGITLFTPLFIILITGLLFNIEFRSNAWKHIFVLPVSRRNLYLGKYLFLLSLVFVCFFLFLFLTLVNGTLLGVYRRQLSFLTSIPDLKNISVFLLKFFIGTLAVIAIHFWLSFRIKNLIANLGIGLAGVAFAIILNGKGGATVYYPYSFPIMMLNYQPSANSFFEPYHIMSLIYFAVFSAISYWDFTRRFKG